MRGQDSASSHYLIVMPAKWSGVLVVHAHGGPSLGTPKTSRNDEDIKRWAITVREGHAWAGSVFRQGGLGNPVHLTLTQDCSHFQPFYKKLPGAQLTRMCPL